MKISKWIIGMVLGMALITSGCMSKVPAGNVGIRVNLLGGNKGVDSEIVPVGWAWVGINQELYLYPTWQQNYVYTKSATEGSPTDEGIDVQTAEGMTVGLDVGLTFHFQADKVPVFFQKYRKGVEEIRDVALRNSIRNALVQAASNMTVDQIYGPGKAQFIDVAQKLVQIEFNPVGLMVDKLYLVGNMRLPGQVVQALNAKIEATQSAMKAENEVRQAEAEAKKRVAAAEGEAKSITVKAEAQAKANQILNASITPTLVDYIRANKWNGSLPQVTGGATPFINLSK